MKFTEAKLEQAFIELLGNEEFPIVKYGTDNNIYKFVNQLEITGTEKRIPDGIIYINGLPVVVFEFKSAIREETTIHKFTEDAELLTERTNVICISELLFKFTLN